MQNTIILTVHNKENSICTILEKLIKNTSNNTKSKTPGVSKVPVVGNLFKSKNRTDELVELLIFIAPRVID